MALLCCLIDKVTFNAHGHSISSDVLVLHLDLELLDSVNADSNMVFRVHNKDDGADVLQLVHHNGLGVVSDRLQAAQGVVHEISKRWVLPRIPRVLKGIISAHWNIKHRRLIVFDELDEQKFSQHLVLRLVRKLVLELAVLIALEYIISTLVPLVLKVLFHGLLHFNIYLLSLIVV